MITLVIIFVLCLALSAFFSGAEMAFVSANLIKFRELSDSGNPAAKKILRLLEKPHEFLTVILIGNNVVNVISTAILTYFFQIQFQMANEWLITALMGPFLIVFCETVPKDYCRVRSQSFLLKWTDGLNLFIKISEKPARLILRGIDFFLGSFGAVVDRSIFVSEKEFRSLVEESAQTGVLASHEKQLIDTIMDFERIKLESVMTPVEKMDRVDITDNLGRVKEIARKSNARMILVSEELPTLIVGMIYVFDTLFETNDQASLKKYLRSPIFLHRHITIEKAFLTLQEKRQSFAAVTDDDGEVIGVVAVEKLLVFS